MIVSSEAMILLFMTSPEGQWLEDEFVEAVLNFSRENLEPDGYRAIPLSASSVEKFKFNDAQV